MPTTPRYIYTSYDPRNQADCLNALNSLEKCIKYIQKWMTFNKLKLNMEKTEFLIIGSEHNSNLTLNVDTTEIKPVSSVRNLGVFFFFFFFFNGF